jgi:hypothetical protein
LAIQLRDEANTSVFVSEFTTLLNHQVMKKLLLSFATMCSLIGSTYAEAWYSAPLQAQELMFGNALKWSTIREISMKEFVLEKSTDGVHYDELATLEASSFSNVDKAYHFMDVNPLTESAFYRLKEIAQSGRFSYSQVVEVEKKIVNDLHMLSMTSVQVNKQFTVKFDAIRAVETTCTLKNFKGEVLDTYTKSLKNGLNEIVVELGQRPPGIYFFSVKNGEEIENFTLTRVVTEETIRPPVAELGGTKRNN